MRCPLTAESVDLLDDASRPDKLPFPMSDDLDGMAVFVAVAEARADQPMSFRRLPRQST